MNAKLMFLTIPVLFICFNRVTSSIMGEKKVTVLPKHDSLSALLERFNEFFVQTIRQNMDQEDSTLSPSLPVGEAVSSVTVIDLSN